MRRPLRTSLRTLCTLSERTNASTFTAHRVPAPLMSASTASLILAALLAAVMSLPGSVHAAPCWRPPVVGPIVDHFREPGCPYCAGNRGIEILPGGHVPIRAVEAGVVTFSGSVAGTVYVVIEHANGWKVTYGRLAGSSLDRGQRVARGARVGTTDDVVYFGLRIAGEYRDPEPYLGQPTGRPRLIPVDETLRRAVPAPTWTCHP